MNKNWTREETIVAFWAFSRIPFKESSSRHPEVIRIANIIGRTPAALNMKIGNIGRLDPSLAVKGITGLTHGAKMEENEKLRTDPRNGLCMTPSLHRAYDKWLIGISPDCKARQSHYPTDSSRTATFLLNITNDI